MSTHVAETSLTTCQNCKIGMLQIDGGTDPEKAKEQQRWQESYVCDNCGSTGTYEVDERGATIQESFTGACKSYE